MGFIKGVSTKL